MPLAAARIQPDENNLAQSGPPGKGQINLLQRRGSRALGWRSLLRGRSPAGGGVRLYMEGREGEEWPWCAGFACFVLGQACRTLDVDPPFPPSVSCDSLAA